MNNVMHWETRMIHEMHYHKESCFLTLTYDDDHLPEDRSLSRYDLSCFFKRLRKAYPAKNIRYVAAGEYGTRLGRPHYHVILFGLAFDDLLPLALGNGRGDDRRAFKTKLFKSQALTDIWGLGFTSVGDASPRSFRYVAKYTVKKSHGNASALEYVNLATGEIHQRIDEFIQPSLGIGKQFFMDHYKQLYEHDGVVIDGYKRPLPRYYDKLYEKINPQHLMEVKAKRVERLDNIPDWDKSVLRGNVKEQVALSRYRVRERGKFKEV